MPRKMSQVPPGFYSAGQARARLYAQDYHLLEALERAGRLTSYPVPGKSQKMYKQEEVNHLAQQLREEHELLMLETALSTLEFRQATIEDIPAIIDIFITLGWPYTPASKREAWYRANDHIDYVVVQYGHVLGFVNAVPYREAVMEEMMAGRKRGWNIKPEDILPFVPRGKEEPYDLFVGLAERSDLPTAIRARCGRMLILGLRDTLFAWAREGFVTRRLYATSAEEDGIATARLVGFERLPAEPGDLFGRYMLDLFTSDHPFAYEYRQILETHKKRER